MEGTAGVARRIVAIWRAIVVCRLAAIAHCIVAIVIGVTLSIALAFLNGCGIVVLATGHGLLVPDPVTPRMADGSADVQVHGWPVPMCTRDTMFAIFPGAERTSDDLWWPASDWLFAGDAEILAIRPTAVLINVAFWIALLTITLFGWMRWKTSWTLSVADALWVLSAAACAAAMMRVETNLSRQLAAAVVGFASGCALRTFCGVASRGFKKWQIGCGGR